MMLSAVGPEAWSAFNALVRRLPEADQDRAGDLVSMAPAGPKEAVALLYLQGPEAMP